jgi:hypothetical protein
MFLFRTVTGCLSTILGVARRTKFFLPLPRLPDSELPQ